MATNLTLILLPLIVYHFINNKNWISLSISGFFILPIALWGLWGWHNSGDHHYFGIFVMILISTLFIATFIVYICNLLLKRISQNKKKA